MMKPAKGKQINISMNGPYVVTGGVPLAPQTIGVNAGGESVKWVEGKAYPRQESYALCRCGQSRKKPFCDGSHSNPASTARKRPTARLTWSRRRRSTGLRCH